MTATLAAASAERRRNSRRYRSSESLRIDRPLQDVEPFVELCVGDGQGHERADDVAMEAGAQQQEATVAGALDGGVDGRCRGVLRRAVLDELDGLHRADTACLADHRLVLRHGVEALADAPADRGGATDD